MENYEILGYLKDFNDIKISNNNQKLAYIRLTILSDIPDSFDPVPYENKIQVYVNNIPGIEDITQNDDIKRKQMIRSFMNNYLLITQPLKKIPDKIFNTAAFFQGKRIKLLEKHTDFDARVNKLLVAIPTFYKNYSHIDNINHFVNLLKNSAIIDKLSNPWSLDSDDIPLGIIWKDTDAAYLFFDINKQNNNLNDGIAFKMNSLKYIKFSNSWFENQYKNNNLTYVFKSFLSNEILYGEHKNFLDTINQNKESNSNMKYNKEHLNIIQNYNSNNNEILNKKLRNDDEYDLGIILDKTSISHINNFNKFMYYYLKRFLNSKLVLHKPFDYYPPFCFIWKDELTSYLFFDVHIYKNNAIGIRSFDYININNNIIEQYDRHNDLILLPKSIIYYNEKRIQTNNKIRQLNFFQNENDKYIINNPLISNNSYSNTINTNNIKINNKKILNAQKRFLNNKVVKHNMDSHVQDNILKQFFNTIHSTKYNLTFSKDDIINFHNSVKSNMLTILTGLSGTGKSKIATAYADSLGIKNDNQFNMVSVRPFWQDDSDLLGFVNTLNNTYNPGDSGVIDTLIHAQNNPNQLHIIVLDEMNLARVEYYFSQFLSVLEKNQEDRYIQLYNKSLEPRLYNSHQYPYSIKIPDNVRFIGTMNIDETTFQLSDKVLDRSNVITLKQQPFLNMNESGFNAFNSEEEVSYQKYVNNIHNNEYKLNKEELQFFDALNNCIKNSLPNVGISWRTVNNIEKFLSNVSYYNYTDFNRQIALDYQIAQRILPKLRGTESMLYNLLNLSQEDKTNKNSIEYILNNYNTLSNFENTKSLLNKKSKEIKVIGFAN